MKEHKGMRPMDVVVLLKLHSFKGISWSKKQLADSLFMNHGVVGESLNRSAIVNLIDLDTQQVNYEALFPFIVYGLPYVFPAIQTPLGNGMLTGLSGPPFNADPETLRNPLAWPDENGEDCGNLIEPLHQGVPAACKADKHLYQLMCLVEVFRAQAHDSRYEDYVLLEELLLG